MANIHPQKHILNNKVSENMKQHITNKYKFQLEMVSPGCHHQKFQGAFLSVLAGMADLFPLHLWDRLLPQTNITLNFSRQSNATPNMLAYAHLLGPFDYNKMPLAPMGCEVQAHKKTDKRGMWSCHLVDGWYLSTSPEHYRINNCHIKSISAKRLTDTIQFLLGKMGITRINRGWKDTPGTPAVCMEILVEH
jgi:hypothetical protein